MNATESGLENTRGFLRSAEFDNLIYATKEFWDECDYTGNPGAPEDDINRLIEKIRERNLCSAPEGYITFLRKQNGIRYKGLEVYSTYFLDKAIDNRSRLGLVGDHFFLIGRKDEKYLAYDSQTGRYAIIGETEIVETYDSFAGLFRKLMQGELDGKEKN